MRDGQYAAGVEDASFLFAAAPTYEEYLEGDVAFAPLLRARMAEVRIPPSDQLYFAMLPEPVYLVAVAPGDSPSTAAVLPIVVRIARLSPRIELRVLQEEEGLALLSKLVDDPDLLDSLPEMDLPLVVLFDRDGQYVNHWGPHPQAIDAHLDEWLARHPTFEALIDDDTAEGQAAYARLIDELAHEMRLWFNSGLNQACVSELRAMFPFAAEDGNGGGDQTDFGVDAEDGEEEDGS